MIIKQEIDISNERKVQLTDKLTAREEHLFRGLIGQLCWVVRQMQIVAFDTCEPSTVLNCAKVVDIIKANKVVRKLSRRIQVLFFHV